MKGHGRRAMVKELSLNRANAVKEALVNKYKLRPEPVRGDRLRLGPPGRSERPRNHAKNRRVEVKVYPGGRRSDPAPKPARPRRRSRADPPPPGAVVGRRRAADGPRRAKPPDRGWAPRRSGLAASGGSSDGSLDQGAVTRGQRRGSLDLAALSPSLGDETCPRSLERGLGTTSRSRCSACSGASCWPRSSAWRSASYRARTAWSTRRSARS